MVSVTRAVTLQYSYFICSQNALKARHKAVKDVHSKIQYLATKIGI